MSVPVTVCVELATWAGIHSCYLSSPSYLVPWAQGKGDAGDIPQASAHTPFLTPSPRRELSGPVSAAPQPEETGGEGWAQLGHTSAGGHLESGSLMLGSYWLPQVISVPARHAPLKDPRPPLWSPGEVDLGSSTHQGARLAPASHELSDLGRDAPPL